MQKYALFLFSYHNGRIITGQVKNCPEGLPEMPVD
jgi:hypothetical protein